jgi:hypothetical protein
MITVSSDEEENRHGKTLAHAIANEIFVYCDERVGHAEDVPKEELILASYERLGNLLGQWACKLDRLERVSQEPEWLRKFVQRKESDDKEPLISYDSVSLGFPVQNMFFAKERNNSQVKLSDDRILISEPASMFMEDFKNLILFCEENGLDFYVDGFNSKEPGRTFRLAVYAPKLKVSSQREFREKSLLAVQVFKELSNSPSGIKAVERKVLIKELKRRGEFDEDLAKKIIEIVVSSKLIPQSLIIES